MTTKRLSGSGNQAWGRGCNILFFLVFLLAGLGAGGVMGWFYWQDYQVKQTYLEGGCLITGKRLLESSDEDGTTYAPEFDYVVTTQSGERFDASGYRHTRVYSSGRRGKEAILAQYQIERSYPCWYDPQNPSRAVLDRGSAFGGWGLLFLLFPLIFGGVGLAGIAGSLAGWGRSPEAGGTIAATEPAGQWIPRLKTRPGSTLSVRLPEQMSHGKSLLGGGFIALFWNGIVAIFVVFFFTAQSTEICLGLFLIPFVLVGLFLIFNFFRQLVIWITAGETVVELSAEPLHFGQQAELMVSQEGGKTVQELQVKLVCQERATYRRGTDTHTDEETIFEQLLFERVNFRMPKNWQQTISLETPREGMHSFKADNNEIRWSIQVSVKVSNAPDFEMAFPLRVLPADTMV